MIGACLNVPADTDVRVAWLAGTKGTWVWKLEVCCEVTSFALEHGCDTGTVKWGRPSLELGSWTELTLEMEELISDL